MNLLGLQKGMCCRITHIYYSNTFFYSNDYLLILEKGSLCWPSPDILQDTYSTTHPLARLICLPPLFLHGFFQSHSLSLSLWVRIVGSLLNLGRVAVTSFLEYLMKFSTLNVISFHQAFKTGSGMIITYLPPAFKVIMLIYLPYSSCFLVQKHSSFLSANFHLLVFHLSDVTSLNMRHILFITLL